MDSTCRFEESDESNYWNWKGFKIFWSIKGKENTIVKDPYDKEHLLPEKPTSKINTSLHSIRDIKAIEIK